MNGPLGGFPLFGVEIGPPPPEDEETTDDEKDGEE